MPKSEYDIKSHSSGMGYVYLMSIKLSFLNLLHRCAQYTWQWHSKVVPTPLKWQTHGMDSTRSPFVTLLSQHAQYGR